MKDKTERQPVYRIALCKRGEPVRFAPGTFPTHEAATAAMPKHARIGFTTVVVAPEKARETAIAIKAKALRSFLADHSWVLAPDFDDARQRLTKIADVADKTMAANKAPSVRKGFLKSETGLALFFEVFAARTEWTRLDDGYMTLQEEALVRERANRDHTDSYYARDVVVRELRSEAEAAYDQAVRSLVAASIHADEY